MNKCNNSNPNLELNYFISVPKIIISQAKTKIAWKLPIYSSEPLSVFRNASIHLRIECDN